MKKLLMLLFLLPVLLLSKELSLNEIKQIAFENNLNLQKQKIKMESESIQIQSEQRQNLPTFSLKGIASHQTDVTEMTLGLQKKEIGTHNRYDLILSAQQLLWTGNRIKNQKTLAETDLIISNHEMDQIKKNIAFQCTQLYYQILLRQKQIDICSESIKRLDYQLTRIKKLEQEKLAIPQDTLDIANKKLELLTQKSDLNNQKQLLMIDLKELMNEPEDVTIKEETPIDPQMLPLNEYQNLALDHRDELKVLKTQLDKSVIQQKIIRSAILPQIYTQAEYHYANPGVQQEEGWNPYLSAGIGFTWSPFDWGITQNKEKRTLAQIKILQKEEEKTKQNIKHSIEKLYLNMIYQKDQIALLAQLHTQEMTRYQITEKKYQQAQLSNLDLLEIESKLSEAKIKYEIGKVNLELMHAQMSYYCGMEE